MIPDKVSLNKIYAGVHFRTRSGHKAAYHMAVLAGKPPPYAGSFPIHMHYHFRLHGTPRGFLTAVTKAATRGTISGADRTGPRPLLQNRAPTLRTFPITKRELSLAG